ncbi:MAG: glycine/sarcosine/betaine reductase component B subunit [Synergistales bacterium]|nr:glycine/sarcosine/betaine reductase component B subunit [Synergistales bacterium]
MRLELGSFHVKEIAFGDATRYEKGTLTINKQEALEVVYEDEHITDADIRVVAPGDAVRLVPVKEVIEPRCKVDGGVMFPGYNNDLEPVGSGRTHALKDCCVTVVGKHWGGFQDGLIDMSGPGAKYTYPYSQLKNIVLVGDTDEEDERYEQQKKNIALRAAGHKLAEYIGTAVAEAEPEEMEVFDLEPVAGREERLKELPSVVYVVQLQTQMEELGYNSLVYGWDGNRMLPTFMHPNEIFDGAVISGSFMPVSSKMSTYDHQNNPTIKRLMKEHGETLNFLGVIVSNLNVSMEQKRRSAIMLRRMAEHLGAEGAIVAEEGYGNPDVDFIQAIVELERAGIKTAGITNECTGRDGQSQPLVSLHESADAIVSTGNVSQLIELPPMDTVIGELESLARDGLSGGWEGCVREDGSLVMENNAMFCGDEIAGFSVKTCVEY